MAYVNQNTIIQEPNMPTWLLVPQMECDFTTFLFGCQIQCTSQGPYWVQTASKGLIHLPNAPSNTGYSSWEFE